MLALAQREPRASSPLALVATASPVSLSWPGSGYGNKGYTGREMDGETGLIYYRARYYDPKVGRFISEDPVRWRDGDANLYAYVKNNPVRFVDPTGRVPVVVIAVGAAVVVAGVIAYVVSPTFREIVNFTAEESFEELFPIPFIDLVTDANEIVPFMERETEHTMTNNVFVCIDRPFDPACQSMIQDASNYCKVRQPQTSQGQEACRLCEGR